MDNAFLRNFLKAREAQTSEKKKSPDTDKVIAGSGESKKGITLLTIIEDTPPKSKVLEYLRHRIDELEADDD